MIIPTDYDWIYQLYIQTHIKEEPLKEDVCDGTCNSCMCNDDLVSIESK